MNYPENLKLGDTIGICAPSAGIVNPEKIEKLELAKKALVAIWKYQKHPIKKIIVYREGVNDKQIPTITQFELPQFRKGFNKALEEIKNLFSSFEDCLSDTATETPSIALT